jgi:hypothetical protein
MIAAWQKGRNKPPTGFLTAAQQQALLKEAAPALSRYDEQKKAEEEARAGTAVASPVASAPVPSQGAATGGRFDGRYSGGVSVGVPARMQAISVEIAGGRGSGMIEVPGCGVARFALAVSPSGDVAGQGATCAGAVPFTLQGRIEGDRLYLVFDHAGPYRGAQAHISRRTASAAAVAPGGQASPPDSSPTRGLANGTYTGGIVFDSWRVARLALQLTNGSGTGTVTQASCGVAPMTVRIDRSGNVTGELKYYSPSCNLVTGPITGRVDGKRLLLTVMSSEGGGGYTPREFVLTPGGSQTAAASPSLPSPDGLWRGSYSCGAARGSGATSGTAPFSLPLEVRLSNGEAFWNRRTSSTSDGGTLGLRLSINGNTATVTRS